MTRAGKTWLVLACSMAALAAAWWAARGPLEQPPQVPPDYPTNLPVTVSGRPPSPELAKEFLRIEAAEKQAADAVWAPEKLAQECGRTVELFWDALNASSNRWSVAATLGFEQLSLSAYPRSTGLAHQIELWLPSSPARPWNGSEWKTHLHQFERDGWRIANAEFRHNRFETNSQGFPSHSLYHFAANLTNALNPGRASVEGGLAIHWGEKPADGHFAIRQIDATALRLTTRSNGPAFRMILDETVEPGPGSLSIDPLLIGDLDGDGWNEIILAGPNLVYRREQAGVYKRQPLCAHSPGPISTALIADFDSDGTLDLLSQKFDGLFLHPGTAKGTFEAPPLLASAATKGMLYPMAMTSGDIDNDGDLDVYIGQYKDPYQDGSMPTPFYDASDGWPGMLLLNDGRGLFRDATAGSGLDGKLRRRAYSSSFVPLDEDSLCDLVVISDFAGIDVYRNAGLGKFKDATPQWVSEPRAFGMAHCFADFNRDGVADLFLTGMNSPTVERLNHLRLSRGESALELQMRTAMTVGSRLLLGSNSGHFTQTSLGASAARTGWAWGCAAPDVDNDGFADLFVVNGLESNRSVREYEPEYWLHDRFAGDSHDDPAAQLYFRSKFTRTRGRDYSYGGHEKNRLYLNQQGGSFIETGHVLGVADELDSRNALAADLNHDGRMDLIYLTWEIWPARRQRVRVLENQLEAATSWIAVELPNNALGIGARAQIIGSKGSKTALTKVAGESYGSQNFGPLHTGLGAESALQSIEVRWPNGEITAIQNPGLNQVLKIAAPRK